MVICSFELLFPSRMHRSDPHPLFQFRVLIPRIRPMIVSEGLASLVVSLADPLILLVPPLWALNYNMSIRTRFLKKLKNPCSHLKFPSLFKMDMDTLDKNYDVPLSVVSCTGWEVSSLSVVLTVVCPSPKGSTSDWST